MRCKREDSRFSTGITLVAKETYLNRRVARNPLDNLVRKGAVQDKSLPASSGTVSLIRLIISVFYAFTETQGIRKASSLKRRAPLHLGDELNCLVI